MTKNGALPSPLVKAAALAILASISLAWWFGDAVRNGSEWCPDAYCIYLSKIHWALTGNDLVATAQLREFVGDYTHAHSPLGPFLGGVLLIAFPSPIVSFVAVSLVSTFIAWSAVRWSPSLRSMPPAMLVVLQAAFFSNAIVIRSFARPITDAIGLACTISALVLTERFLERRSVLRAALLVTSLLVGMFSRVSFLPVLAVPPTVELFLAAESLRKRGERVLFSLLIFTVVPLGMFFLIGRSLGIEHLDVAWQTAHLPEFTSEHTLRYFIKGSLIAGIPYVLLRKDVLELEGAELVGRVVHGVWILLYLSFLAAGEGALWGRYFLPIVPSVLIVAASGTNASGAWRESLAWPVAVLAMALIGLTWSGAWSALAAVATALLAAC